MNQTQVLEDPLPAMVSKWGTLSFMEQSMHTSQSTVEYASLILRDPNSCGKLVKISHLWNKTGTHHRE